MADADKQLWSLGKPHISNEDSVIIWVLGRPFVVIDSTTVAAAEELGAFYMQHKPLGVNIQSAGQVRSG